MADKWRQKSEPKHVRLYAQVTGSEAWKHTSGNAIKVLLALIARDDGTRNGKIGFSCREASEVTGLSDRTCWRCFLELQEKGFIVCTAKGGFSRKVPHSSLWRYTWVAWPGGNPAAPTRDFAKWRPDGNTRQQSLSHAVDVSASNVETERLSVEDNATGKLEKPVVSTDPDSAETTTLTVYQGDRFSAASIEHWKHRLNPDRADLSRLRERLLDHLKRSEAGEQSRLAARAKIPPGTLSKFIHGRPLPECHQSNLCEIIP